MRRLPVWLKLAAGFTFAFLYLPLLVVVVYSFNDSRLNAEWVGFTLDWYVNAWSRQEFARGFLSSLQVALLATVMRMAKPRMRSTASRNRSDCCP